MLPGVVGRVCMNRDGVEREGGLRGGMEREAERKDKGKRDRGVF